MNTYVKTFLVALNLLFIVVAAIWAYRTPTPFEPMLALGGFFANTITLLFGDAVAEKIKVSRIEQSKVNIERSEKGDISVIDVDNSTINIKKPK